MSLDARGRIKLFDTKQEREELEQHAGARQFIIAYPSNHLLDLGPLAHQATTG